MYMSFTYMDWKDVIDIVWYTEIIHRLLVNHHKKSLHNTVEVHW